MSGDLAEFLDCFVRPADKFKKLVAMLHARLSFAASSAALLGMLKLPKEPPGEASVPMFGVASGVGVVWSLGGNTEVKMLPRWTDWIVAAAIVHCRR